MKEKKLVYLSAWATKSGDVGLRITLGEDCYTLDLDLEDAKTWATTISRAVSDVVDNLPPADIGDDDE